MSVKIPGQETKPAESTPSKPADSTPPTPAAFAFSVSDSLESLLESQAEKLNLPEFLEPDSIPVGSIICCKVLDVIGDFTGRKDMADAKNWIIECYSIGQKPVKRMFPQGGVVEQATLKLGADGPKGKLIVIKRLPDSSTTKYGAEKRMFMFDIWRITPGSEISKKLAFPS